MVTQAVNNETDWQVEVIIAFVDAVLRGQTERMRDGTEASLWPQSQFAAHYVSCLASTPHLSL